MTRLHKLPGIFHYQQGVGLFFIALEEALPFQIVEKKLLQGEQAAFYSQTSYYGDTVELRFDATRTVLASIASAGLATESPRRWLSALVEFVASGRERQVQAFVRKFVTHEEIARRAYSLSLTGPSGSTLDHWLRAEDELLSGPIPG